MNGACFICECMSARGPMDGAVMLFVSDSQKPTTHLEVKWSIYQKFKLHTWVDSGQRHKRWETGNACVRWAQGRGVLKGQTSERPGPRVSGQANRRT